METMSTETGSAPTARRCERCGSPLTPYAPKGLCPACMLVGGLESGTGVAAEDAPGRNASTLVSPLSERPGDRIDRYKLPQKIGEGGCGTVYMAEQEQPVRRRVPLKSSSWAWIKGQTSDARRLDAAGASNKKNKSCHLGAGNIAPGDILLPEVGLSGLVVAILLACTAGLQAAGTLQFPTRSYRMPRPTHPSRSQSCGWATQTRSPLWTTRVWMDGTAIAGVEYAAVSGTLTSAAPGQARTGGS